MIRRKGELSLSRINRDWPHQVSLPADAARSSNKVIEDFCHGLSACARGHSVRIADVEYRVFCFAELAHANLFCAQPKRREIQSGGSRTRPSMVRMAEAVKGCMEAVGPGADY